jgi:Protein of unknown function (DUF3800)
MYLCYIDESGTPEVPGNTSHFILCGIAIPIWHWRNVEQEITFALKPFGLDEEEFHTAWLMRPYIEQSKITNFAALNWSQRRAAVEMERNKYLLKLQKANKPALLKQTKKNYKHTSPYIHLTFQERKDAVKNIAHCISRWGFARLFAECIDKLYFNPAKTGCSIDEQAFEQVVSRFEQWVTRQSPPGPAQQNFALIVHDMNQTVAAKHSNMMRQFFKSGTLWTTIKHIVETPFFVDSSLTRMVQMADVCAWALRRFCENNEEDIFNIVFQRADRYSGHVVGVRHFSNNSCNCHICKNH